MLNISDETKQLLADDSVQKQLLIKFPNNERATIDNSNIISESMELTEILCDEEQIKFGLCNSSEFSVQLYNVDDDIKGCTIKPYLSVNDEEIPLGVFVVYSVKKSVGKPVKDLVAYDLMTKFTTDVSAWYKAITFPITLKDFRDSLFTYIGITQADTTLIFDDLVLTDNVDVTDGVSGIDIIQGICEINGRFGRMNRYGQFEYVKLDYPILYPSATLYPSDKLFPNAHTQPYLDDLQVLRSLPVCEEYKTVAINGVIIQDENGTSYVTTSHDNPYVLNDNFITYGRSDLQTIANTLSSEINGITYKPSELDLVGLPYMECGDAIQFDIDFTEKEEIVETFIFSRTLTGITGLVDAYESKGNEYLENDLNSITKQIANLNTKTDKIEIQVEATEEGLSSKVSKDDLCSEISQSADEISIKSNRFSVESDNFTLTTKGEMTATSGTIGGWVINDTELSKEATLGSDKFLVKITSNSSDFEDGIISCYDETTGKYVFQCNITGLATTLMNCGGLVIDTYALFNCDASKITVTGTKGMYTLKNYIKAVVNGTE